MLLELDFSGGVPIYMQIRNQIVMGIADGRLAPGERLPTIRALADEAGINMMTVNKAYQLLKREGYIAADRRSGAIVAVGGVRQAAGGAGAADDTVIAEKVKAELKLLVSEAKLKGFSREAFLKLAGSLYDESEV
jgi:DNA-binding transcriptional regulator YhcF (GntR family)